MEDIITNYVIAFIILLIKKTICSDIELPFSFSNDDIMMTELTFSDNYKSMLIPIDLQSDKSYINRNLNQSASSDIINIGNQFFTFSYNTCQKYQEQSISFAYGLNNTSFVNQLKEQKIINKSTFSFYPLKDPNYKGIIYFSKLNQSLISNKNKKSCSVRNNKWACLLQTISFNNNEYQVNDIIQFDTKMFPMIIPYDIFSILITKYALNKCTSIKVYFDYESKVCKCKDINNIIEKISLKIDNNLFSFNTSSLFINIHDDCYFMLFSKKDNVQWTFGTAFMLKFITTFDNENKEIIFYDDYIHKNNNFSYIFLITTTIILLFGLTLVVYYKCK